MDSRMTKHYGVDECDPKKIVDLFFSPETFPETTTNMMTFLHTAFATGCASGKSLIDISFGPIIFHLLPICEFLEEITVLEISDLCMEELVKWWNKDTDTYDWTHALSLLAETNGSSDGWEEKEDTLISKIEHIGKCDFRQNNPTDPLVLQKVDCVMSLWVLDMISKDQDSYCQNLKKISSLIKLGGYIFIFGGINTSYVTIAEHKYHFLNYDDNFLKDALSDEGYIIEHYQYLEKEPACELIDRVTTVFVVARKVREVKNCKT
ncbi:indolethylamine N-methyltransferase-like [Pseudophryne corroboree]|uniref:indolethylamine N-methyltransferase-like n=1 Tax=Pseudophryne corroboree TaxID=495146 RepID=UPI003081BBE8